MRSLYLVGSPNALPESTPQFSGLMPKLVWSADLKGFILN